MRAAFCPAIDITRSVSRIGGKAQIPAIKAEAGRMKLDFLQFLELEVFTRFGSRLDPGVEAKIRRGHLLRELLKQDRLAPLGPEQQLAWLMAYNEGFFDGQEGDALQKNLARLLRRATAEGPGLSAGRDAWRASVAAWCAEWADEPKA